jgi:hypothetical protein
MDAGDDNAVTAPRRAQWIYLVPVIGAPVAHIFVSATRMFPRHKRLLLGLVAVSTATAVINRLWLMGDAGFPGAEGGKDSDRYDASRGPRDARDPTGSEGGLR